MGLPGGRAVAATALLVALLGTGLGFLFAPMIGSGFHRVPGDQGDPRLNHYLLEHQALWLAGRPDHARFWSPPIFHPATNTLAYSDTLASVAPLYAAGRASGLSRVASFQVWLIALATLNFAAAWAFLHRGLRFRLAAAGFGAFLFAFSAIRSRDLDHPQLLAHFFTPLALWGLAVSIQATDARRRQVATVAFSLCVAAQFYAAFYLGYFLVIALLVFAAANLSWQRSRRPFLDWLGRARRALAVGALLTTAALVPLAAHYIDARREVGMRPWSAVQLATPLSWMFVGRTSWLYGWQRNVELFRRGPNREEPREIGIGWVTSAVATLGLVQLARRRAWGVPALVTAVLLVFLVTDWFGWLPWRAAYSLLPGAAALRAIHRMSLVVSLAAAVGWSAFVSSLRGRALAVAALGLGALLVAEQARSELESHDPAAVRRRVDRMVGAAGPGCSSFYAIATDAAAAKTSPDHPSKHQLDAMEAQLRLGIPTINGYLANLPPGYHELHDNRAASEAERRWLAERVDRWAGRQGLPGAVCLLTASAAP